MRIFVTIIKVALFACSLNMLFNKHAVVLLNGQERRRMRLTHFFPRRNAFSLFLYASFKFKYELWWYNSFKAKRKSCNNSSHDMVLHSSCRVSLLLRSVPSSFLMIILPRKLDSAYVGLYRWTSLNFSPWCCCTVHFVFFSIKKHKDNKLKT